MHRLRRRLEKIGIELQVESDHGRFLDRFEQEIFDFVVVDLFDDRGAQFSAKGNLLAERIGGLVSDKPWYPIFIVTSYLERLSGDVFEHLPDGALLRYKADPVFIARLIQEDLKRRGVFISRRKVFLIQASKHPQAKGLRDWLKEPPRGLTVETVEAGNLDTELARGLRGKMNACGAILAVLTEDVELSPGLYRTRPNIILEIGMALALNRGIERLIMIRKDTVERPSDIGGLLTLDYKNDPLEIVSELEQRLSALGVDLSGGV
jgi:hypothetical protein